MDRDRASSLLASLDIREVSWHSDATEAVRRATQIYSSSVAAVREAFSSVRAGNRPSQWRGYYPYFAIPISSKRPKVSASASSGFCHRPGLYTHTASRPDQRFDYYVRNIANVLAAHETEVAVGISPTPVPLDYIVELNGEESSPDFRDFTRADYAAVIEAQRTKHPEQFALSPYDGAKFEYFWEKLRHYIGGDPSHIQSLVILFNYRKYEAEVCRLGRQLVKQKRQSGYQQFVVPEGYDEGKDWQMPAFHLKREDGKGITFINFGVGAPNAVTICEALCALRPDLVMMLGHCGGTRLQQEIGNFVLGSGYVDLTGAMRFKTSEYAQASPLGEVQRAEKAAISEVYKLQEPELGRRVESGVICSVDYRHWVIEPSWYQRIAQTRAAAVDMESAAIAYCCLENRTPYGFMGLITDIPAYARPKLRGASQRLYEETRKNFVRCGVRACEILRRDMEQGTGTPHSRKISPPFVPYFAESGDTPIPFAFA